MIPPTTTRTTTDDETGPEGRSAKNADRPSDPRPAPSRCRLTLTIGSSDYRVKPLRDVAGRVVGWRLRKVDGGALHVVTCNATCDCEAFRFRGRDCKHCRALRALGLIR
jgi:SWIM zinc finger